MLSRVAKSVAAPGGEQQAARPQVARAVAFGREQDPARDDRDGADDKRRAQRLVEEHERDRDGHERCGADGDRGA